VAKQVVPTQYADVRQGRLVDEAARAVAELAPAKAWQRLLDLVARAAGAAHAEWRRAATAQTETLPVAADEVVVRLHGREVGRVVLRSARRAVSPRLAAVLASHLAPLAPELKANDGRRSEAPRLIGASPQLAKVRKVIELVRDLASPVLIEGESGTGKELIARALHEGGARRGHRLVTVECANLKAELAEAELFGYARGAFTGAAQERPGLFEVASGGTVFLDEITETSTALQAKLLRVLEAREVRRIGEARPRPVDVRILSATNRDIKEAVRNGSFREDLYYRLNVISIYLPPLRERREDVEPLLTAFLAEACARAGRSPLTVSAEALAVLVRAPWPGNARELGNVASRLAALAPRDVVSLDDLPMVLGDARAVGRDGPLSPRSAALLDRMVRGDGDFFALVAPLYRARELPRTEARALVAEGLERTRGRYRGLTRLFGLADGDYRRFMSFLRDNELHVEYRPFRGAARRRSKSGNS